MRIPMRRYHASLLRRGTTTKEQIRGGAHGGAGDGGGGAPRGVQAAAVAFFSTPATADDEGVGTPAVAASGDAAGEADTHGLLGGAAMAVPLDLGGIDGGMHIPIGGAAATAV